MEIKEKDGKKYVKYGSYTPNMTVERKYRDGEVLKKKLISYVPPKIKKP